MRKRTVATVVLLTVSAIGTAAFALREKPAPVKSSWPPRTPEYFAQFAGDQPIEWVREILDEHPRYANARTVNGHSPLHELASENKVRHLRLLLERGAEPNGAGCNYKGTLYIESPLSRAAWRGQFEAGRVLLEFGADPNYSMENTSGSTHAAFAAASGYGRGRFIYLLFAAGADIDIAKESGYTPLASAILFLKVENVRALIACGADVRKQPNGQTYLHKLASGFSGIGQPHSLLDGTEADQNEAARGIALALLASGLPVDAKNREGQTVFELRQPERVAFDGLAGRTGKSYSLNASSRSDSDSLRIAATPSAQIDNSPLWNYDPAGAEMSMAPRFVTTNLPCGQRANRTKGLRDEWHSDGP